MRIDWAAQVLRDARLTVVEEEGWGTRGAAFATSPLGIIIHHDASHAGSTPEHPSVIINGRSDLAGPLSQWYLSRTGVWHVVASGKANHAGAGTFNGLTRGNANLLGVEAANNGAGEAWPEAQMVSYATGIAAILEHLSAPSLMAIGHKEWAPSRKTDPSFDMDDFRARVSREMNEWPMRFPGVVQRRIPACRGTAPRWIRQKLVRLGHDVAAGDTFNESTERAVRAYRIQQGLGRDGVVDQRTWNMLAAAS